MDRSTLAMRTRKSKFHSIWRRTEWHLRLCLSAVYGVVWRMADFLYSRKPHQITVLVHTPHATKLSYQNLFGNKISNLTISFEIIRYFLGRIFNSGPDVFHRLGSVSGGVSRHRVQLFLHEWVRLVLLLFRCRGIRRGVWLGAEITVELRSRSSGRATLAFVVDFLRADQIFQFLRVGVGDKNWLSKPR